MTNYERIKTMAKEELAIWLAYVRADISITGNRSIGKPTIDNNLDWLNKDAEGR